MPDKANNARRFLPKNNEAATLENPLENPDGNWHPDYLKGRLLEEDEKSHFQLLWLRAGRTWFIFGNITLIVVTLSPLLTPPNALSRHWLYLGGVTILSVLVSPIVVYRQYKKTRKTQLHIRKLNYMYRRQIEAMESGLDTASKNSPLAHQKRYRDDMPDVVSQYREEADRNRKVHNRLQSIVIIGSVATSAITTASVSYSQARWSAVGVSAAVGLAAGFMGYFKYHERAFSAQQAADAIEREYEAVVLRVGKYITREDKEAYALFAEVVESIRDEQNKRQQQLDQPVAVKREERPALSA